MTDILLVEDDHDIADFLQRGLEAEGYSTRHAASAAAMRRALHGADYGLVVLDRMLPDGEGAELCAELRADRPGQMILMLTAKDALEDKLQGLRAGADDYLTKPFAFQELLARIEALRRRGSAQHAAVPAVASTLTCGPLVLDLMHKAATRDGTDLGLTPTEFGLLRFLVDNVGRVVNRMEILAAVWGKNFDPNTNLVEVYIAYLRRKADGPFDVKLIRNIRGFGYVLELPDA